MDGSRSSSHPKLPASMLVPCPPLPPPSPCSDHQSPRYFSTPTPPHRICTGGHALLLVLAPALLGWAGVQEVLHPIP